MKTDELIEIVYNPDLTRKQRALLFNELVRLACQKRPQEIIINIECEVLNG